MANCNITEIFLNGNIIDIIYEDGIKKRMKLFPTSNSNNSFFKDILLFDSIFTTFERLIAWQLFVEKEYLKWKNCGYDPILFINAWNDDIRVPYKSNNQGSSLGLLYGRNYDGFDIILNELRNKKPQFDNNNVIQSFLFKNSYKKSIINKCQKIFFENKIKIYFTVSSDQKLIFLNYGICIDGFYFGLYNDSFLQIDAKKIWEYFETKHPKLFIGYNMKFSHPNLNISTSNNHINISSIEESKLNKYYHNLTSLLIEECNREKENGEQTMERCLKVAVCSLRVIQTNPDMLKYFSQNADVKGSMYEEKYVDCVKRYYYEYRVSKLYKDLERALKYGQLVVMFSRMDTITFSVTLGMVDRDGHQCAVLWKIWEAKYKRPNLFRRLFFKYPYTTLTKNPMTCSVCACEKEKFFDKCLNGCNLGEFCEGCVVKFGKCLYCKGEIYYKK